MSMMPVQAAIGIGGNLGDRAAALRRAITWLEAAPALTVLRQSSWYETRPVGYQNQPAFLNAALVLKTTLTPEALLSVLLDVEQRLGRVRAVKNGPRIIDLDVLLYGEMVIEQPGLTIPHPRMAERAFVLAPLAEIWPDAVHPVRRRSIAALLEDLGRVDHLVSLYQSV